MTKIGIGQDSHRFLSVESDKICVIGGVEFHDVPGFDADSDGDVIFHSICNAISSITHIYILGEVAPALCKQKGITDSRVYLNKALETLDGLQISHVALAIEAERPRLQSRIREIRQSVARAIGLTENQVGLTCTSGDKLSDFARGDGIQCFAIITFED